MKFWKTVCRSFLEEFGLLGHFLADKIDGGQDPYEGRGRIEYGPTRREDSRAEHGAAPITTASSYRPPQEILYQVLTNNTYWRTVGAGINVGTAVAEGLNRLKGEYPDVPVRAVDKITQALVDIRT